MYVSQVMLMLLIHLYGMVSVMRREAGVEFDSQWFLSYVNSLSVTCRIALALS